MKRREITRKFDEIVEFSGVGEVPRHAGQALLERDVRPARVLGRRAPRARDPARRRGARRRRRRVPAALPRADGGPRRVRPDGAVRLAQHAGDHDTLRPRDPARAGRRSSPTARARTSSRRYLQSVHGTGSSRSGPISPRRPATTSSGCGRVRVVRRGRRDARRRSTCAARSGSRSASPCCATADPIVPKVKLIDRQGNVIFNAMDAAALGRAVAAGRLRRDRVDPGEPPQRGARSASRRRSCRSRRRGCTSTPGWVDVVSFHVQDPGEGDSARGTFTGQWRGVVRPLLEWTVEER